MMIWVEHDLFYGKVKFCNVGFSLVKKGKQWIFSEIIVACDPKFLDADNKFMKVCEY